MSPYRRSALVLVSIGWIVPLALAFWAEHGFLVNVVWASVATGVKWGGSFHPVDYAPRLFCFSMIWLAAVITGWVWRLTRPDVAR
jgi:hypothetical protein